MWYQGCKGKLRSSALTRPERFHDIVNRYSLLRRGARPRTRYDSPELIRPTLFVGQRKDGISQVPAHLVKIAGLWHRTNTTHL